MYWGLCDVDIGLWAQVDVLRLLPGRQWWRGRRAGLGTDWLLDPLLKRRCRQVALGVHRGQGLCLVVQPALRPLARRPPPLEVVRGLQLAQGRGHGQLLGGLRGREPPPQDLRRGARRLQSTLNGVARLHAVLNPLILLDLVRQLSALQHLQDAIKPCAGTPKDGQQVILATMVFSKEAHDDGPDVRHACQELRVQLLQQLWVSIALLLC
mmetsp:Transcript_10604/g.29915  ORF Transcript_10604/g.29915 Transcript_10604/m.29915 type:complete len:210 (+) Transcript_10604:826-1455(+)